jgi:DNA-binding response OmpR family regulator
MQKNQILIVDDDPNIQELLIVNLEAQGYKTISALNGKEVFDKIKTIMPDLIILDIMMPEIDGLEVAKMIRDSKEFQEIKILMLTAKGTERDKMIGKDIFNANEYMTKPFDIDNLLNTIKELLK